ncbi:hypothetical protein ACWGID_12760 [Kribbella sp. NPDC054772]
MSDLEKSRAERDARRTVATRRSGAGSASPEQAILRHLGIEFYKERRGGGPTPEPSADEQPANGSADR